MMRYGLLCALALLATAAGAVDDAHAQTNTDRLITVIQTTADTNSMVAALLPVWSNFDFQFPPLAEPISGIAEGLDAVSADIGVIEGKVAALAESVGTLAAAESQRASLHQSGMEKLDKDMSALLGGAGQTGGEQGLPLGELSGQIDQLGERITSFIDGQNALKSDIDAIKENLGMVQTSVEAAVGPAAASLHERTAEKGIPISWYARGLTSAPSDNTYTAEYYLECDTDVFLQFVSSTIKDQSDVHVNSTVTAYNPVYYESGGERNDATLAANGTLLFDSAFETGGVSGGDPVRVVFQPETVSLGLLDMGAGGALKFTSAVTLPELNVGPNDMNALPLYVAAKKNDDVAAYIETDSLPANIIGNQPISGEYHNITKAELGSIKAYTITVDYLAADPDAKCDIRIAADSPLDNRLTLLVPLQAQDDDGSQILAEYNAVLDCDLNPVSIANVTAQLSNAPGLNNYVNMEMAVGDDTKAEFTFENGNAVIKEESSLPFEFSGEGLTLRGDIVRNASILAEITYDTIQGAECAVR